LGIWGGVYRHFVWLALAAFTGRGAVLGVDAQDNNTEYWCCPWLAAIAGVNWTIVSVRILEKE
jgi:hypothetical protein